MKNIFTLILAILFASVAFAADQSSTCIYRSATKLEVRSGCTLELQAGSSYSRASVEKTVSAGLGTPVSASGWAMPSAHSGLTVTTVAGLPASKTGSTFVLPLTGLKVGDTISSFKVIGQIESAGGAVTLDADLRKVTTVAADSTDASIGGITQVAVTADTVVAESKTLDTPEVVAANETFYVLVTGTTAGSTDIQLSGVTFTANEG